MPRWCRIVSFCLVGALAFTKCAASSVADRAAPSPRAADGGGSEGTGDAALEREVHDLVNRYRSAEGLAPLRLDPRISEQARLHSAAMATGRARLGHQGFEERIRVLGQAMRVQRSAENVAVNQGYAAPARQALDGWLSSRTHRANIEGPYAETGIGVARTRAGEIYFTQIFIGG